MENTTLERYKRIRDIAYQDIPVEKNNSLHGIFHQRQVYALQLTMNSNSERDILIIDAIEHLDEIIKRGFNL